MAEQSHLYKSVKLGEHFIYDLSDCDPTLLFDSEQARRLFTQVVRNSGLSIVGEGFFQFSPHGFTCYLLLEESHASLHAWPEYGYCAIDVFTCNLNLDLSPLFNTLKDLFGGKGFIKRIDRRALVESETLKEMI